MKESLEPKPNDPDKKAKSVTGIRRVGLASLAALASIIPGTTKGQNADNNVYAVNYKEKTQTVSHATEKKLDVENTSLYGGTDTAKEDKNLKVYTHAHTQEGGTTPTGLSNSFVNNPYGIKTEDLPRIGKRFNLPMDNEEVFQAAVIDYVEAHYPEVITKTMEEFGSTNHEKDFESEANLTPRQRFIKGLKDGKIGGRTAFYLDFLDRTPPETPPIPEIPIEQKQPHTNFIINVRGDSKAGAYYFPSTLEEFKKITKNIGASSVEILQGGKIAQATVDMDNAVWLKDHVDTSPDAAEIKTYLGAAYKRYDKNPKLFTLLNKNKNESSSPDDLVQH